LGDCGVNAIMTESDSYELSALDATLKAGLRFFAGVACFSDHASNFHSLNKRPELWPVLENGERRPRMEWYVGMSPTDRRRQEEALAEIKPIARTYPVDGVFLDFARWPLHWEIELRPGRGRPLDSTFDPATLAKFEEATGALPRGLDSTLARAAWIRGNRLGEWVEFKCKVVNDFVGEARNGIIAASFAPAQGRSRRRAVIAKRGRGARSLAASRLRSSEAATPRRTVAVGITADGPPAAADVASPARLRRC
jgi:hypothetical protein